MSVVQDRLLTQAPDNRQKAQSARPEQPSQSREKTEFSNVYARERANSAVESKGAEKRPDAAVKHKQPAAQDANEPTPTEPNEVVSGKELPLTPEPPPETDSQTLQWLGLEATDDPAQAASDVAAAGLLGVGQVLEPQAPDISATANLEKSGVSVKALEMDLDSDVALPKAGLQRAQTPELTPEEALEPSASGAFDKLLAVKPLVEEVSAQLSRSVAGSAETSDAPADSMLNRFASMAPPVNATAAVPKGLPLVPGQAVPMQQPGWSSAVVDRVMWLSSQNLKTAEIQLDPAELGHLEVRISLNQDSTQITFASLNANVRDALEAQMHRLRELFAQQGMNQLDVNVSDQSLQRQQQGEERSGQGSGARGEGNTEDEGGPEVTTAGALAVRAGLGLIDYYA